MLLKLVFVLVILKFVSAVNWQGNWAQDCDFAGNDLGQTPSPGNQCSTKCAQTAGCTHFTWSNFNGGTCFMKKGPVGKHNAFFAAGRVCGINPNGNTGNTGNTGNQGSSGKSFFGCEFKFGHGFEHWGHRDYEATDYITMWAGTPSSTHGTNFNPYFHGDMLKTALKFNKLPVFYGYIIAFMGKEMWNLKDCDVGTPSLCQQGAKFIRSKRAEIVAKYKHYGSETAKIIGRNGDIVWLLEPDFWQYYGNPSQEGGVLSGSYLRALFDDIAVAIKSELPNAKISWDISAWIGEAGMTTWWGFFASSPHIDYINTSGGKSQAASVEIKKDELKWRFMSNLTKKKIIADTGYGVNGASDGHIYDYDNLNNLKARIADGVIAVTQANPKVGWKQTTAQLRQSLPKLC